MRNPPRRMKTEKSRKRMKKYGIYQSKKSDKTEF